MKRAFAAALGGLQSLRADEWRERPVDRLGALGSAQIAHWEGELDRTLLVSLGVDLVRFKLSGIASAEVVAQKKLSDILVWERWWGPAPCPLSEQERKGISSWAVREWAGDKCPPRPEGCGGALEVPSAEKPIDGAQPMMVCPKCRGTGVRRWTDAERIEAMGRAYPAEIDQAHAIIGSAERLAISHGMKMLERWPLT